MAPPSWTQTLDTLFSTTWANRKTEAIEQAFLKTPFIYWLREKGRVENQEGYRQIEIPLDYGTNETIRWIGKGSQVPMTDSEIITLCWETWKYVSGSVMRWFTEDQQNRGKAQAINLVDRKLNALERALYEELERVFFSDGTGALEPNGLQNLISSTPTVGTVHGLNRATYDWWQNQQKTSTGSAAIYLISDMRTVLNNVLKYSKSEVKDIFIVTDQTSYELFEDVNLEMKSLGNTMLANAGFDTLQYRGRPIMWSPFAPASNMYFINPAYVKLVIDESFFMEMTSWKEIPDQPFDKVAQVLCTLNMITSRPIVNAVLTAIAA